MSDPFILLVEDNNKDEILTLRALSKHRVANRIEVVRDGQEALDFLFASGMHKDRDPMDFPIVVLLDLQLPKVGGLQVLERVRSDPRTRVLPVVILTSSSEERDVISGYRLGANSYVQKPVGFEEFSHAVAQLGLYWAVLNHPLPAQRTTP
ncbi:MAG: response regulator [Magnetococcales bacterium]|nr:response regulator [Magnetococcales bacterium]MBF0155698.1 response regulator [Magnetococcales bacterium]